MRKPSEKFLQGSIRRYDPARDEKAVTALYAATKPPTGFTGSVEEIFPFKLVFENESGEVDLALVILEARKVLVLVNPARRKAALWPAFRELVRTAEREIAAQASQGLVQFSVFAGSEGQPFSKKLRQFGFEPCGWWHKIASPSAGPEVM